MRRLGRASNGSYSPGPGVRRSRRRGVVEAAGEREAFAGGELPRAAECLDVARLCVGGARWRDIRIDFVRRYAKDGPGGGFEAFKQRVQEDNKAGERQELADALGLLEQYGAHALEQHVNGIVHMTRRAEEAEVLFSTTHKSKGLGWPHVLLADDFMARGMDVVDAAAAAIKAASKAPAAALAAAGGLSQALRSPERLFSLLGLDLTEEVNTTYVAMTRAMSTLHVPAALGSWLAAAGVSEFQSSVDCEFESSLEGPSQGAPACAPPARSSAPSLAPDATPTPAQTVALSAPRMPGDGAAVLCLLLAFLLVSVL